jgi:hypothetical protein
MRIVTAAGLAALLVAVSACSKPWKEYSYPAWGFAASFREMPKVTDTPSGKDGAPASYSVETVQGDRHLVVSVIDTSNSGKTDEQVLRDIPDDIVRSTGGTVTGHAEVTSAGVAGRELTIDRGNDPTERVRVFAANHRVYQVITETSQGADDPEATKFLTSFRLLR